jgi:hypothetical protein
MHKPSYEQKLHLEIADRWSPYLEAVSVDTTAWEPEEIFILAEVVWRDASVQRIYMQKLIAWNLNEKPKDAPETLEGFMSLLPSRNLLLETVQELSPTKKADLKSKVLNARSRVTRAGK